MGSDVVLKQLWHFFDGIPPPFLPVSKGGSMDAQVLPHWGDHVYDKTEASVARAVSTSDCTTVSNSSPSDCSQHVQSTSDTSGEYLDGSQFSDSDSSDSDDGTSEDSVGYLGHWSKVPTTLAPTIGRCRTPYNKYNNRCRCQEVNAMPLLLFDRSKNAQYSK